MFRGESGIYDGDDPAAIGMAFRGEKDIRVEMRGSQGGKVP